MLDHISVVQTILAHYFFCIQIENKSLLTLKYSIHMDSRSLLRHEDMQQLPEIMTRKNEIRKSLVGEETLIITYFLD